MQIWWTQGSRNGIVSTQAWVSFQGLFVLVERVEKSARTILESFSGWPGGQEHQDLYKDCEIQIGVHQLVVLCPGLT